ncbi:g6808 [Coccomyxa elongata]
MMLCVAAVVLVLAGPALAQLSIEDLENLKEIADFFDGAASDQFPNTKPETLDQQHLAVFCGLGTYNDTSPGAASASNINELLYELTYACGKGASNATNSAKAVIKAGSPDTSHGTAATIREAIVDNDLITLQIWSFIANVRNASAFLELSALAGSMGFNLRGAYPAKAVFVEQYYKPTVVQRASETIPRIVQGKPKTLYIGSDTMVMVSQLGAPAPPTTAVFLFHATIGNNFCNWGTDFNYWQVPYPAPAGLPDCSGCLVHEGFLAAFQTVTNASSPSSSILASWEALSGVAAADVTEVICAGHSLGAALAALCGPWAKSTFPNARVTVYHSGSPRVFSPEAAKWWDAQMGANSSYRVVNNMDIVPSMPKRYIVGNYGLPLRYDHVGSPIWMYREGRDLPGNYTAFAHSRPDLYTGRIYDHTHGYILGLRQIVNCNF